MIHQQIFKFKIKFKLEKVWTKLGFEINEGSYEKYCEEQCVVRVGYIDIYWIWEDTQWTPAQLKWVVGPGQTLISNY